MITGVVGFARSGRELGESADVAEMPLSSPESAGSNSEHSRAGDLQIGHLEIVPLAELRSAQGRLDTGPVT